MKKRYPFIFERQTKEGADFRNSVKNSWRDNLFQEDIYRELDARSFPREKEDDLALIWSVVSTEMSNILDILENLWSTYFY